MVYAMVNIAFVEISYKYFLEEILGYYRLFGIISYIIVPST